MRKILLLALTLVVSAFSNAAAQPVVVPAASNLFGAGHATPPGPGGNGGGQLPVLVDIPDGMARTVRFADAMGTTSYGACCPSNTADGNPATVTVPLPLWDGLAGTDLPTRGRYLAAVFLDDEEPSDPAPERLTMDGIDFVELTPGLRQIFFLGDGLTETGAGEIQTFHVPDNATRLYLGFQDRCGPSPNVPGWYGDNSGAITITPLFSTNPVATAVSTWGRVKTLFE